MENGKWSGVNNVETTWWSGKWCGSRENGSSVVLCVFSIPSMPVSVCLSGGRGSMILFPSLGSVYRCVHFSCLLLTGFLL